ncbi:MAG: hypothetical protein AAGJ86_04185 [Pseudomonadota bacterium]
MYPESPNTYDSLGEALLTKGDHAGAIVQYQKVLAMDPDNTHAMRMIEGIKSHISQ